MTGKVVIFGNSQLSTINHFYLTHDTGYEVVGFTVDRDYMQGSSFCGLPIVPYEEVEATFPPAETLMSVLLGFRKVNALRVQKFEQAKQKGYRFASYVSSRASIWPETAIGENSFIYENCIIQPFAEIGSNAVISPGAMVGHHSKIGDHVFVGSGVTILGNATIGSRSVIGASATINDGVTVAEDCIAGAGVVINKDLAPGGVYVGKPPEKLPKSSAEIGAMLTWSNDIRRR